MKEFVTMCQTIGTKADYVQGGGGNASCKHKENIMAIKASGFTIGEITQQDGYADVNYIKIRGYHTSAKPAEYETREKESTPFTLTCVSANPAGKVLRPSVEAGFHSLLKKYVMHTHPVYVNVITCAENGEKLVKEILPELDFVWIPYINPGFSLTLAICQAISEYEMENGVFPKVIFLQNHGFITTSDSAEECTSLHVQVNEAIKKRLNLPDFCKDLAMQEAESGFVWTSPFVQKFLETYGVATIEKTILYPDQLVYLNGGLNEGKITFNGDAMVIRAPKKEAMAIQETFVAFAYVVDSICRCGFSIRTMDEAGTDFINNWESEKYRKSIAGQK